jgi:MoaA/NifB/PqqE/SkfB family radical SAM enzyme
MTNPVWNPPRRGLGAALRLLAEPVPREKKARLADRWRDLDPSLRTPQQGFGRQATGCGATIGVMPKCDFDCVGCYLGEEANRVPRLPLAEVLAQLDQLRAHLGPKGNVQITDGEVTLLPPDELVAILRHAREIGLLPMVMTHGDTFRRRPELLRRLVAEAGLREVSIHVDTLQRGRRGTAVVADEAELAPIRAELAGVIAEVRRATGVRLRSATTMTISRDNLAGVPAVVDWCLAHRDVFGFMSFQPLAQVGRTREELRGVGVDELWAAIGSALAPYGWRGWSDQAVYFGHPACTRMEVFLVYQRPGETPRLLPLVRPGHPEDLDLVTRYLASPAAGVAFREDTIAERVCRSIGMVVRDLPTFAGPVRRWLAARCAEVGTSLAGLAMDLARGRARLDGFTLNSHHFMSDDEVHTPLGQERLAACVFRLPVNGEMVPMCRVNTMGVRETFYAAIAAGRPAEQPRALLPVVG